MTRTTNTAAANFLDKLQAEVPFAVTALQVHGGSKFMADFETACQAKQLPLYVLPPMSPKLNGAVERANGSWREEFYAVYDLPGTLAELNPLLDSFQHLYNQLRPHGALHGLTPARGCRCGARAGQQGEAFVRACTRCQALLCRPPRPGAPPSHMP